MAHQSTIAGLLVGTVERPYKPFTDGQGNSRPGGVTRYAFVSESFAQEPTAVKVPGVEDFSALVAAGFGADIECECTLFAKGNRIEASLNALTINAAAAKRNGREPIRAAS